MILQKIKNYWFDKTFNRLNEPIDREITVSLEYLIILRAGIPTQYYHKQRL
jgi:hypothetical protein